MRRRSAPFPARQQRKLTSSQWTPTIGRMKRSGLTAAAPNLVTTGNLVVGLVSIAMSAMGHFQGAAWAIVYCGILDKVDGTLARKLGVQSQFGMEMDSFADYTSFGLAPAALCWFLCTAHGIPAAPMWIWIAFCAALLPVSDAVRLARFNACGHEDPSFFSGVPTTMMAGLIATFYLSLVDLQVSIDPAWLLPSAAVVASALMVCRLRIPKLKGQPSRLRNVMLVSTLLGMTMIAVLQVLPEVLFCLGCVYVIGGSIRARAVNGQQSVAEVSSQPGGDL